MPALHLPLHPGLSSTTRLRFVASKRASASAVDWTILLMAGIGAALASAYLDLGLKGVPGHAILRVVFPISLGLALVPRRGAGSAMASTAFLTGVLLYLVGVKGEGAGLGALTSLTATGPLLDLTLQRTKGGWRQYVAFGLAGLFSNTIAFAVRAGAKLIGWEAAKGKPLGEWLAWASVTYVVCGLLAGLISGAILFYGRGPAEQSAAESAL